MVPTYGIVIQAVLLVAGLWWCKEIFGRFRTDLARLKESPEPIDKAIVIFFWLVTLVIIYFVVRFTYGLAMNVRNFFWG